MDSPAVVTACSSALLTGIILYRSYYYGPFASVWIMVGLVVLLSMIAYILKKYAALTMSVKKLGCSPLPLFTSLLPYPTRGDYVGLLQFVELVRLAECRSLQEAQLKTNALLLSAPGAQALIAQFPEGDVLAIKGTTTLQDIAWDLQGASEEWLGFSVYGGWVSAFTKLEGWLLAHLDPRKPLVITGHSLGSAQAVLAHIWCSRRGMTPRTEVFACPKIGCAQLLKEIDAVTNIRNLCDVVPCMPMEESLFGPQHSLVFGLETGDTALNHYVTTYIEGITSSELLPVNVSQKR